MGNLAVTREIAPRPGNRVVAVLPRASRPRWGEGSGPPALRSHPRLLTLTTPTTCRIRTPNASSAHVVAELPSCEGRKETG